MTRRATIALVLNLCSVTYGVATTVLVYVSPQEAFIAADSLSNRMEGGQRMVCKIVQVSDHMLFAASGTGVSENPHFNPYDLAKLSSADNRSPHEAATKYASDAIAPLQEIWRARRARYLELAEKADGPKPTGPQDFNFVGLDKTGLISGSGTTFVEDAATPPNLRANQLRDFTGKNADDIFLYRTGVIENLPSNDDINGWIKSDGAPAALKRAIEMQIKATPDLVGGEISIVRLGRDGSIHWVNRGTCQ
jgi:hypothetical protein